MSQIKKYSNNDLSFEQLSKKVLIQDVHVYDPAEKLDDKLNILIENGKIAQISKKKPVNFSGKIIKVDGALVLPGLFDMHVHLREPGREDEETIMSG